MPLAVAVCRAGACITAALPPALSAARGYERLYWAVTELVPHTADFGTACLLAGLLNACNLPKYRH